MKTLHDFLSKTELEDMRNYIKSSEGIKNFLVDENCPDEDIPEEHRVSIYHFYENDILTRTFIITGKYIYMVREMLDKCF